MLTPAIWLMLNCLLYSLRLSGGTGSFPQPLDAKQEQHYLTLARQGDQQARNILIERNLRLVAHIMKKYYTQTSDQEDLISIGTIGLIKAIETFDMTRGARLATYAARCVENEILMHFRAQRKSSSDVSLSDYIETGKDGAALSLMDVICSEENLFETLENQETCQRLHRFLQTELTPRERDILLYRYGFGGNAPMTQRQTAQLCNISRSYVSRIEKRALQKLAQAFEREDDG